MKRFLPILIIFTLFLSCNSNTKDGEEKPNNFTETISSIHEVKLPLALWCGAENYIWLTDVDSLSKYIHNDGVAGKLPSKDGCNFLLGVKVDDIIYPHLLVFDSLGNKVDSLYLHSGMCAADAYLIESVGTTIHEDYSIVMSDTIWYGNFATDAKVYDSIKIRNSYFSLQNDFKYKIQNVDSLMFRSEIIHKKVDSIIGQYHIKFYFKENGNIISQIGCHSLDRSVYLTLSKNGSPILDNHLITRNDFTSIILQKELNKFQLWNMWVKDYSDTYIRLNCNVCVPESDNCYLIIITIDDDGNMTYEEEEVVWDEDE